MLVKVAISSINGFDAATAAGYLHGSMEHRFPLVVDKDFAGTVEALGEGVEHFTVLTSRRPCQAGAPAPGAPSPPPCRQGDLPMNVVLWIVQAVLAAMFGMAGAMKSTQPKDKLAAKLPWVEDFSAGAVRLIGITELAGALGLILPAATGIAPILTPLAALTHVRRKEPSAIAFNALLFLLAAFVAWGRFGPYGF